MVIYSLVVYLTGCGHLLLICDILLYQLIFEDKCCVAVSLAYQDVLKQLHYDYQVTANSLLTLFLMNVY